MAGKSLKGTKSHENLKEAFAGESQANRRYLYFARVADIEGFPDMAGLFKDTADAETGHAFGHMDFLKEVGDPATGEPFGKTEANLKSAVAGETYEYTQMYPGMAKTARDEGPGAGRGFETLAAREVGPALHQGPQPGRGRSRPTPFSQPSTDPGRAGRSQATPPIPCS
jgi:rubrerythrin